jgi:glycosyltransferase involved in cell wall biosynthesis
VIPANFAIPGDIHLPTGGYVYARRLLTGIDTHGVAMQRLQLPGSFPAPSSEDLAETERILVQIHPNVPLMIDGLAFGAMPTPLVNKIRAPIIALVHHPLCRETGITPKQAGHLYELEKAALTFARRVIVSSPTTARTLTADFAVRNEIITVAEPGTEPSARSVGTGNPLQLLAIGSIVPRKAYDVLIRGLHALADRDWRLTIVGATDRSAEALAALDAALQETGLGARVTITGALPQSVLARYYRTADVFIMPSLYEGYGMVLAEAMAHGLPIVCTTGGAAAETAPDAAAIKVPPGDPKALGDAVSRLIDDAQLRTRLADASWTAGQTLPRWDDTARRIAAVIKGLAK